MSTTDTNRTAILKAENLYKVYGKKDNQVIALNNVNLEIEQATFTAIMGASGCGKSTLMHCLAGIDNVSDGKITIDGTEITSLSESKLTKVRRDKIGFIFQSFNLIPTLNIVENITLPLNIAHKKVDKQRLNEIVEKLDLQKRVTHKPSELSGGQQQRVACARSLLQNPAVLFADEPTGNLDSKSSKQVLDYIRNAVDEHGQTVIMVTHEVEAATYADRILFMRDGQIIGELNNPDRNKILEILKELD